MTDWTEDLLSGPYQQREIPLGKDPDGEGTITATLVRHREVAEAGTATQAVIHVHGFTDYFFQEQLADFFVERDIAFYALDLRKCGRSLRPGHTPHYVSDLALYDAELEEAVRLVHEDLPDASIMVMGHSTGGLVLTLWLDRINQRPGGVAALGVNALVLNSPWFDLQGDAMLRTVGTQVARGIAKILPKKVMPVGLSDAYGLSMHVSTGGEWEYDLDLKPLDGFPVTFGWLNAVRRGHAALHHGLNVGVPSLVLRSNRSHFSRTREPRTDIADSVLNVRQIAQWAGCVGGAVTSLPIQDAKHDVFLSFAEPRREAYEILGDWMHRTLHDSVPTTATI